MYMCVMCVRLVQKFTFSDPGLATICHTQYITHSIPHSTRHPVYHTQYTTHRQYMTPIICTTHTHRRHATEQRAIADTLFAMPMPLRIVSTALPPNALSADSCETIIQTTRQL